VVDVRVLDVTEYADRSNPLLPVQRVLVTYVAPDGRLSSLSLAKDRATREAITSAVMADAETKLRLARPVGVRYADHLLPPAGR